MDKRVDAHWAYRQVRSAVLEVAVGSGRNVPLCRSGTRLVGFDVSPGMLARAHQRVCDRAGVTEEMMVAGCGIRGLADGVEEWFRSGACDGFVLAATHLPGAFEEFVAMVVPELQRRGLYRTAYEGTTLRDQLGLARP